MSTATITAPTPRLQIHRRHHEQTGDWIDVSKLVGRYRRIVGSHASIEATITVVEPLGQRLVAPPIA